MNAIRVRKTIESETLHLPELGAYIGRTVDIVIEYPSRSGALLETPTAGIGDWDVVLEAAQQLPDYDYDAQRDQDERDRQDSQEQVR
jgi:hypothetical protein